MSVVLIVRKMKKYYRVKEERNILHRIKHRTANWIGHILRRNCLLEHVAEDKRKGIRSGRTRKKTKAAT